MYDNNIMSSWLEKLFIDPTEAKNDFVKTSYGLLKKAGALLTLLNPPTTTAAVTNTQLKASALDAIERATFDGAFKYYGNYGGPNFSAGKYYKRNEIITKDDLLNTPAKDDLDKLFLEHDLRYQRGATHETVDERSQALRHADKLFVKDVEDLLRSKDLDLLQRTAANGAMLAFKSKLATDIGYKIDRLFHPDARIVADEYLRQIDPNSLPKLEYENTHKPITSQVEDEYEIFKPDRRKAIEKELFTEKENESRLQRDIEKYQDIIDFINDIDIDDDE